MCYYSILKGSVCMGEAQFIQLGKEALIEIQVMEECSKIFPKLNRLQFYIINNPDKQCVQDFISDLLHLYLSLFLKRELIYALNLSESVHYYKQLLIYLNLPYTTHPLYASYLPQILQIPSEIYGDIYGTFAYVLQKYAPKEASNAYLQAIFDFVKQNPLIIRGSKDDYYSLADEIRLYNYAKSGYTFKTLNDFAFAERLMDPHTIRTKFMNKRIGNIGEIYNYELIRQLFYHCFVSRDVKNGFGYDIYYYDYNRVENLVEVKTTMSNSEDDVFGLSENEYKEMKRCVNNPYARYIVCRVRLDSSLRPTYTLLTLRDDITLVDIHNPGIEYKLCPSVGGSVYFRRYSPSLKRAL